VTLDVPVDLADPVPEPRSRSGCATCATSRCCLVFDPELTGADLHRLVRGLGLAPSDIAALVPVRADQAEGHAIHFGDDRAWELRLRRTSLAPPAADSVADPAAADLYARRCGFLVGLAPGVDRCGVYAHRPMVCRTFPTDLTALGVMVGNPLAICPPGAWTQARADLAGLARLHARARHERRLHAEFLVAWNAAARPPIASPFEAVTEAMLTFWDHHMNARAVVAAVTR